MNEVDSEEEYDKFGEELQEIQDEMKKADFPLGQVSGWDDDTQGVEDERNPHNSLQRDVLVAAENGDLAKITSLISSDPAAIHAVDRDGYTPLHRACYNGHSQVVDFLLKHGANISAETEDGWQPLHSACKWNNTQCVAKLLEHGADPNATSKGGVTPLHLAASNSYARDTLQLLLLHPDIKTDLKTRTQDRAAELAERCGKYGVLFEIAEPCINKL